MTALFSPFRRWGELGTISFRREKKFLWPQKSQFSVAKSCCFFFWGARREGRCFFLYWWCCAYVHTILSCQGLHHPSESGAMKSIYSRASHFKAGVSIINYNNRGSFNGSTPITLATKTPTRTHTNTHPHTHFGLRLMQRACLLNAHRKWWDI